MGDIQGVFDNEIAPGFHNLTHQFGKNVICEVCLVNFNAQERAVIRIKRGFPQLFGVHFAKALIALDRKPLAARIEDGGKQVGWPGNSAVA
jgi:hypothetical protein